jgi:hypothetical protein
MIHGSIDTWMDGWKSYGQTDGRKRGKGADKV